MSYRLIPGRATSRVEDTIERVVIMHPGTKFQPPPATAMVRKNRPPFPSDSFLQEKRRCPTSRIHPAKAGRSEGNVSRAAELMGVDRSHLYRRMRALESKSWRTLRCALALRCGVVCGVEARGFCNDHVHDTKGATRRNVKLTSR